MRGSGLMNDAQAMLKEVSGKISGTLDTVTTTVSNVNDIAVVSNRATALPACYSAMTCSRARSGGV
jgi:hypothetical protein